jgi:hypothetical protein
MSNLELWNKVKQPPKSALKTIQAGRLKGMTDINPQWRLEAITERFGQCGIGWHYTIERMWTENGANGEVMAFVHVHLYTAREGNVLQWSMPIVGIGGSALVAKESAGLRANDEAYKMALTDALSVAMKQLGFAADIYAGRYDGSKYRDEPKEIPKQAIDTKGAEDILETAVEFGTETLKKAWGQLSEPTRIALKDKLAGYKESAAKNDNK